MNPIIMLIVAVLFLIGAIVRTIEWKKIAVKWVAYNPKKCILFIRTGDNVSFIRGNQDVNNSLMYEWKTGSKEKLTITLPGTYPHLNLISEGRRIIGIRDGVPVASPLGLMTVEEAKLYKETIVEVSALTQSQMVVKALKSISQSKPINWMMIAIVAGAVIVGFWYYQNNIAQKPVPVQSGNTTLSANTTTPSNIIIITPPERVIP